ncbi:MAG TPA: PHP domain-containing protein [Clostridiales bacterium]|jgi:predicted metal-dependent phosphoesterase TrpH|nr:PHP domain-containing protein [Clostridiales bacterium]
MNEELFLKENLLPQDELIELLRSSCHRQAGEVDLHVHSAYSDGEFEPACLIHMAKQNGVRLFALTDHDGLKGLPEAMESAAAEKIKLISGVELSADLKAEQPDNPFGKYISIHLLGYGFDPADQPLVEAIAQMKLWREDRNRRLLQYLEETGIGITKEELAAVSGISDYVGKPNIARALAAKYGLKNWKDAFAERAGETPGIFKRPEVKAIRRKKLPAEKAIKLILGAGGVPVLAHPYKIGALKEGAWRLESFLERLERLLEVLKKYGLMGMECRYSEHPDEVAEALLEMAERLDLIATCGSDFHDLEALPLKKIGKISGCFIAGENGEVYDD